MESSENKERVVGSTFGGRNIKTEIENNVDNDTGQDRCNSNGLNESNHVDAPSDRRNEDLLNNDGIVSISDSFNDPTGTDESDCLPGHLEAGCLSNKTNKIQQIVEDATSAESKTVVAQILDQINQLSAAEKLLLYLKLPTGRSETVDPLRQPINPLGNRFEIQQTITWIKTHLEEDSDVSLPKQDVYDEYLAYCDNNTMKPLSTADFGKVMKQVFPKVRPRRLGTRGNSRYCYAGLRKKMKLEPPLLPDIGDDGKQNSETPIRASEGEEEIRSAAACLIIEWAEKLLNIKFESLKDLACYLVEKLCVDSRSVAAFTLVSSVPKKPIGKGTSPLLLPPNLSGHGGKHRETQLQLQRKLQEREIIREQKRKLQDQQSALSKGCMERPKGSKKAKLSCSGEKRLIQNGTQIKENSTQGTGNSSTVQTRICDNATLLPFETEKPLEDLSGATSYNERNFLNHCNGGKLCLNSKEQTFVNNHNDDVFLNKLIDGTDRLVPNELEVKSSHSLKAGNASGEVQECADFSSMSNVLQRKNQDSLQIGVFSQVESADESSKTARSDLVLPTSNCDEQSSKFTFSPVKEVNSQKVATPPTNLKSANNSSSTNGPIPNSKMPIPRLANSKSSCKQIGNIIIIPPIAPTKPRQKYKPIQPKPIFENQSSLKGDHSSSTKAADGQSGFAEEKVNGESSVVEWFDNSGVAQCDIFPVGTDLGKELTMPVSQPKDSKKKLQNFDGLVSTSSTSEVSIPCLEKDAFDDYLQGGNSQEQEEELMQYFNQNTGEDVDVQENPAPDFDQLRRLLAENLVTSGSSSTRNTSSTSLLSSVGGVVMSSSSSEPGSDMSENVHVNEALRLMRLRHPGEGKSATLSSAGLNVHNASLGSRRRVSFETSVTEHHDLPNIAHPMSVPPSPNTYRRNFSFQPISPGYTPIPESGHTPHSPGQPSSMQRGSVSSANVSPFVSPRNTPVPRSRHNSGQMHIGVQRTNSNINHVSENGTPFVSPQSTPVPFARSRQGSSNQNGRSVSSVYQSGVRSRHSSGANSCRSGTNYGNPFSPLSNHLDMTDSQTVLPFPAIQQQASFVMSENNLGIGSMRSRHSSANSMPPMSPNSAPHSPMVHPTSDPTLGPGVLEAEHGGVLSGILRMKHNPYQHFGYGDSTRQRHISAGTVMTGHQRMTNIIPISSQHLDPLSQEVSKLLQDGTPSLEPGPLYRSQSVPLHQMIQNMHAPYPTNLRTAGSSSYSRSHPTTPVINRPFTFSSSTIDSASSSVAQTPVPSEYADFGSNDGLLDAGTGDAIPLSSLDCNLDSTVPLMPENINQLLNDVFLPNQQPGLDADTVESMATPNMSISQRKSSRSYPNTPIPSMCGGNTLDSSTPFSDNVSRSYPSTPVTLAHFTDSNFQVNPSSQLTLNAINIVSEPTQCNYTARRNLNDILDEQMMENELVKTMEALQDCGDTDLS